MGSGRKNQSNAVAAALLPTNSRKPVPRLAGRNKAVADAVHPEADGQKLSLARDSGTVAAAVEDEQQRLFLASHNSTVSVVDTVRQSPKLHAERTSTAFLQEEQADMDPTVLGADATKMTEALASDARDLNRYKGGTLRMTGAIGGFSAVLPGGNRNGTASGADADLGGGGSSYLETHSSHGQQHAQPVKAQHTLSHDVKQEKFGYQLTGFARRPELMEISPGEEIVYFDFDVEKRGRPFGPAGQWRGRRVTYLGRVSRTRSPGPDTYVVGNDEGIFEAPKEQLFAPAYAQLRFHSNRILDRVINDPGAFKRFVHAEADRNSDAGKWAKDQLLKQFNNMFFIGEVEARGLTSDGDLPLSETLDVRREILRVMPTPTKELRKQRQPVRKVFVTYNQKADAAGNFGKVYKSFKTYWKEPTEPATARNANAGGRPPRAGLIQGPSGELLSVDNKGHPDDKFAQVMKIVVPSAAPSSSTQSMWAVAEEIVANFLLTFGSGFAAQTKECVAQLRRVVVIEDYPGGTQSESVPQPGSRVVTFLESVRTGKDIPELKRIEPPSDPHQRQPLWILQTGSWIPGHYVHRFHECLKIMERAQVVMNDLKPDNTGREWFNPNNVRFLDFGLATFLADDGKPLLGERPGGGDKKHIFIFRQWHYRHATFHVPYPSPGRPCTGK
ncbi:unnamed protein product [Amoebophrya sp. A120]|nr:unnamed protein product [Amoebophrya sp. A120]|eukprot:GSA120T00010415001.1